MRWCGFGRRNPGLAATPAALADGLSFTNYTTANGLGANSMSRVYTSDGNVYAATDGGVSIAQLPSTPVPGPLPVFGAVAAFGFSRKLRKRVKLAQGALGSSQPRA